MQIAPRRLAEPPAFSRLTIHTSKSDFPLVPDRFATPPPARDKDIVVFRPHAPPPGTAPAVAGAGRRPARPPFSSFGSRAGRGARSDSISASDSGASPPSDWIADASTRQRPGRSSHVFNGRTATPGGFGVDDLGGTRRIGSPPAVPRLGCGRLIYRPGPGKINSRRRKFSISPRPDS
jgi:hypothetical protein